MKKVLMIDYFYPPMRWGWKSLAYSKHFKSLGWEPYILTVDDRCVDGEKDFSVYDVSDENVYRIPFKKKKFIFLLKGLSFLGFYCFFPDLGKKWIEPAFKKGCEIIETEKIDLIYSILPYASTALVASRLKKKYKIPWICHVEDLLYNNDFRKESYKNLKFPIRLLYENRISNLEKKIYYEADHFIVATNGIKNDILASFQNKKNIHVVPIGYDESSFINISPVKIIPRKMTITFLGTIYKSYLNEIKKFLDILNKIDSSIQVLFIGTGVDDVRQLNKINTTCILSVSREKAHSFALGSDFLFLLLPEGKSEWCVPSKLYTYLRLGKPVLGLFSPESEAAKIINEAGAGAILSYDSNLMENQLREIYDQWKRGNTFELKQNLEYVHQFEIKALSQKIINIFDQNK